LPGSPTPCWSCPKQNPTRGQRLERALPKVTRALNLYYQVRGSAGQCLAQPEREDAIVRRNLGIVDVLIMRLERGRMLETA